MNISIVGTVNFGINASKMVLTINNKRRGSSGGGIWGRNARGAIAAHDKQQDVDDKMNMKRCQQDDDGSNNNEMRHSNQK